MPLCPPGYIFRRETGYPSMQSQLLFAIVAGAANLGQPAGSQEASRPAAQPTGPRRVVISGIDSTGCAQEWNRYAVELQIVQAHSAIEQDTKCQTGRVAD